MTMDIAMVVEGRSADHQSIRFQGSLPGTHGQVAGTGEPVLITKSGRPVAELRPLATERAKSP
jgi:hypothetical protein